MVKSRRTHAMEGADAVDVEVDVDTVSRKHAKRSMAVKKQKKSKVDETAVADSDLHDSGGSVEFRDDDGSEGEGSRADQVLKLHEWQSARERTGVVYLSHIPRFMKPVKVAQLLGKYGAIGRVYLTPESEGRRRRRKQMGGNKRQDYVDGWVEFKDKRDAKCAARELNNQPVGGKRRSFHAADIWNIKYLSKFKWHHLTEKQAYDAAARKQRLRMEIARSKREQDFLIDGMEVSRQQRLKSERRESAGLPALPAKAKREWAQRPVSRREASEPAGSTGLLGELFN